MAKPYSITITNGSGSENILNDSYTVTAEVKGYDNSSIDPSSLQVVEGTDQYALKISATGSLSIHVTEDGTISGTPVEGAKFYRADSLGTTYGSVVTTDSTGNATLENIPYSSDGDITIYYIQTESDGEHNFDNTVKSIVATTETSTVEVINTPPVLRTIQLTDANYDGLNIDSGTITLS